MNCETLRKLFTECVTDDAYKYYSGPFKVSYETTAANNLQVSQEMHYRHICNSKEIKVLKKYCNYTNEKIKK
jgi:hypothetical protein